MQKMSLSFSFLSFSNTLCLTCFWGLVAIESIAAKINLKYENDDTVISLTTISTSFFWVGFVLDNVVCFTEFIVVWLKVQAPPVRYYWLSVARYLISTVTNVYLYHLISEASQIITVQLVVWIFCIILQAKCIIGTLWMNKLLCNEVDGINNPVAYAVGPIGMQAMAGD